MTDVILYRIVYNLYSIIIEYVESSKDGFM